jgi:hypothetical protein
MGIIKQSQGPAMKRPAGGKQEVSVEDFWVTTLIGVFAWAFIFLAFYLWGTK